MNGTVHYGMSDKDYFSLDMVSASALKGMQNPERWKHMQGSPPTEAMQLGTDFHAYMLLGILPASNPEIAVSPYDDFRKKEAREWKISQEAEGKRIVKARDIEEYTTRLRDMAAPVEALDGVEDYLSYAARELVITWEREDGTPCKAKLDAVKAHEDYIIDLKTCSDIAGFERQCLNFDYHIQAAWYIEAAHEAGFNAVQSMRFAAVGTTEPHQARLLEPGQRLLDLARSEIEDRVNVYRACIEAGVWPSPYSTECDEITVPGWYWRQKGLEEYYE